MKLELIERFTLAVGLADKDLKKQIVTVDQAKEVIRKTCGDCTIIDNVCGSYTHDDGSQVNENTLLVQLLFKSIDEVGSYCEALKRELNQESIAVMQDKIMSALV